MKSATWTATIVLGMCFGVFAFGQIADRIGRKTVFISFYAGSLITVYLYSRATDPHTLFWVGEIMGMFANGGHCGIGTLMSEAYPTAARATAQNSLFNIGRGVASFAPLAVGALATKYSFSAAIGLLATIYFFTIFATMFLIPELKGRELD